MRKPRPQDFDPDYQKPKTPQPEKVDMSGVIPIKEKGEYPIPTPERKHERTDIRSELRTEERSDIRSQKLPFKRLTKRYSFEFYEDQIVWLKKIKIKTEMEGNQIAMSEIVREALDEYLEKQKLEPFGNSNDRGSERTDNRS